MPDARRLRVAAQHSMMPAETESEKERHVHYYSLCYPVFSTVKNSFHNDVYVT